MNQPLLSIRGLKTHFFGDEGITRAVNGISLDVLPGQAVGIVGESGCGKSVMARSILRIVEKPGRIVDGEIILRRPGGASANGRNGRNGRNGNGGGARKERVAATTAAAAAGSATAADVADIAAAAGALGTEEIDLAQLPDNSPVMRSIRGGDISLVFQEPMTSFSPVHTIGNQLIEALRLHKQLTPKEAADRAVELLTMVDLPRPEEILSSYAWQLSGGLRQRAMIAMALAGEPRLLIADEPTTALDVTTQAQILDLLRNLKRDTGMALMLITHDLAVVAGMADYVVVMYLGEVVEKGPVEDIFAAPQHPYTQALLRSIPSITAPARARLRTIAGSVPHPFNRPSGCPFHPRCTVAIEGKCDREDPPLRVLGGGREASCHLIDGQPAAAAKERAFLTLLSQEEQEATPTAAPTPGETMLEVRGLRKSFQVKASGLGKNGARMRAVDDVNFELRAGETLALVGESGSGKTTVSRCILRALQPDSGEMMFRAESGEQVDLAKLKKKQVRPMRSQMQMIFQDPYSSLNPRMTVLDIIAEPMLVNGIDSRQQRVGRVRELLELVGLPQQYMRRYPHAFSGGQRQRIGIARALAMHPRLIVADEPVSALDVSVQAQILNLLLELQEQLGLTYLFVSHDLSVVKHVSDRIAVMYAGNLVELGARDEILMEPKHPYTSTLLAAVPKPDPSAKKVFVPPMRGNRPNLVAPQVGCYFESRCAHAVDMCKTVVPAWREISPGRWARCHRAEELTLPGVDAALPAGAVRGEARSDL
ncbi:MAG TPA: ABC transporter ATP-binding protein [Streptosporangiaceae bacterium]|nr:ABC transporter ATP-binding protein [Streptosporangiaceae bacterium]